MENIVLRFISDELEKMKRKNVILEIKLENGEILRIFGEHFNGTFIWSLSHVLVSITRKYFQDFDSDNKELLINTIIHYPIKFINIRNGAQIYSNKKVIKRLKEIKRN